MGECSELAERVGGGGVAPPPRQSVAHPAGYPWRVALLRCPLPFHRLIWMVVSHPFPPSCGHLATPPREDVRFPPLELVLRRHIPDGAVQPNFVVMRDVIRHRA